MQGTGVAAAALAAATFVGGPSAPPTTPPAPASSSTTSPAAAPRLTLQPSVAPGGVVVAVVATGLPTRSAACTLLVDGTPTGSCSASAGTLTGSFTAPSGTGPTHDVLVCSLQCQLTLDQALQTRALEATLLVPTPALSPVPGALVPGRSTQVQGSGFDPRGECALAVPGLDLRAPCSFATNGGVRGIVHIPATASHGSYDLVVYDVLPSLTLTAGTTIRIRLITQPPTTPAQSSSGTASPSLAGRTSSLGSAPPAGSGWWPPSHEGLVLLAWGGGGAGSLLLVGFAFVALRHRYFLTQARGIGSQVDARVLPYPLPSFTLRRATGSTLHSVRVLLVRGRWEPR